MSATSSWIKFFFIPLIVSLFWLWGQFCCTAGADPGDLKPDSRKILAFYDSKTDETQTINKIAQNCQMVLDYLGLTVDYQDINQDLPSSDQMAGYRGILLWFESDAIESAQAYTAWLYEQTKQGRKLAILGSLGVFEDDLPPKSQGLLSKIYKHIGLCHGGLYTPQRALLRYQKKDTAMVEFERAYPPIPISYEAFFPLNNKVNAYLNISRTDKSGPDSVVVSTGPNGGLAWGPYVLWREGPPEHRRQWYIDPFAFFSQAFDLASFPKPDVTTLNGRRIAFSHIDGDAFAGFTKVMKKAICADVIRDRILKRYRFPVTVSVIVGEIDPSANGKDALVEKAREIFALPNVEPASHTYSHPYYWDPNYDNSLDKYASQYGLKIPGYEFDAAMEIDYSVRYITLNLTPPGKPCKVLLWSGNCTPLAEHIKRCDDVGALNMNGGDSLLDDANNSFTSVSSSYLNVGGYFQYFTGQANDNILTNLWEGPYYGFREIITTMQRTETPRRIKPIDIYYHFFSGEYQASVKALEEIYEWALSQPIAPMFTSAYIKIVQSWKALRLFKNTEENQWHVKNYGHCLTLRFDSKSTRLDLDKCENVLGFFKDDHGVYVHLAPGKTDAKIVLASGPGAPSPDKIRPYLQTADGWVSDFNSTKDAIRFHFKGFGKGVVELAGVAPGSHWRLNTGADNGQTPNIDAGPNGILAISNLATGNVEISHR